MQECSGDIWDYHARGEWIVITTNGSIRKDGAAVMGRGVALEAAQMFPELPFELGKKVKSGGSHCYIFEQYRVITFPVKFSWMDKANIDLIERSSYELTNAFREVNPLSKKIYMVRPGCGNGRLNWEDVKPRIENFLNSKFVVVEKKSA